jgi:uncharacterized protein YabE (DUF348 family)
VSLLSVRRIAQTAIVTSLVVGAGGFAYVDKSVTLSVDGKTSAVHVFGSTVADVLANQDIKLGAHDLVAPAVSSPIKDNQKVVVRYGRLLTVTVDGQTKEFWTTSTTVAGALAELCIRADSAKLSVSRSQPLGRMGLAMAVTTPKSVTVAVDGKTLTAQTTGATVADVLTELKVTVGAKDRIAPALTTPVGSSGLKVAVARVKQKGVKTNQAIGFGTQRRNDASLFTGDTKTLRAGKLGNRVISHLQTWVNGKLESDKLSGSGVSAGPVSRILAVGTKARPVAAAPVSSGGGSTVNAAGIALGFDPIHYGVLMVVTMLIGAITPPVGSMLFIACSIGGISMEQSLKPLLPCILILVIVCLMILFVPALVTLAASFA